MASFDMVIDTEPMAREMSSVGAGVMGVTGAVVAMQSAVVAEEEESAREISRNVDRGFYMLMKSQISQKMAAMSATLSSKLLLMRKFRADIMRMKETMTKDYNRIYGRYKKQFTSLDKELAERVHALDASTVGVSDMYKRFCEQRADTQAASYLCAEEALSMIMKENTASVKSKTLRALQAMSEKVQTTQKYNRNVAHILRDKEECGAKESYVCALVTEAMSMFDKDSSVESVYLEQFGGAEAIEREVRSTKFDWERKADKEDREKVRKAFNKEIEASGTEERVAKEMKRLFEESDWVMPCYALEGDEA